MIVGYQAKIVQSFTTREFTFECGRGIELTLSLQLCIEDAGEPVSCLYNCDADNP